MNMEYGKIYDRRDEFRKGLSELHAPTAMGTSHHPRVSARKRNGWGCTSPGSGPGDATSAGTRQ